MAVVVVRMLLLIPRLPIVMVVASEVGDDGAARDSVTKAIDFKTNFISDFSKTAASNWADQRDIALQPLFLPGATSLAALDVQSSLAKALQMLSSTDSIEEPSMVGTIIVFLRGITSSLTAFS